MDKPQKAGRKAGTFKKGDDPRRNVTIPGSGRPKDEFKAMMRELASNTDEAITQLRAILKDKDHPHFVRAWCEVRDSGYGKEAQTVEGDMRLTVVMRDE